MSRSGRFGRAPRTAPSYTSTIIAIAREAQQQRDSNIMDAWQKGGTFEGKKVTDALVLKYWKDRAGGVSKDDPLHDTYQNAVTNLDYTIHESKMTAAYALGKKSDGEMVSFYLGWAKKIPKDSEFYRVLQRDAGQYMRSAKNLSQSKIAAAKEKAYQDAQAATDKQYGAAGAFLTDTLRRLNQSGYADGRLPNTIEAPDASSGSGGQDLTSFDPSDPEVSMKLLALITPTTVTDTQVAPGVYMPTKVATASNTKVLYHSDTIDPATGKAKPVTGADIVAQLTKYDPEYKPGMPIDVHYLTSLLDRQNMGLQQQIDRANKTGHQTDAAQLTKQKGYVANLTRQVAAWPVEKAYMDLRGTWEAAQNDPTISPQALDKAWTQYQTGLYALAKDPRVEANDNMRTRLVAEANGQENVPTLGESFSGQDINMDGFTSKQTRDAQGALKQARDQIEAVTKSAALPDTDPTKVVWTYGTTSNDGVFHPDANGKEIGAAPMQAVNAGGAMGKTVTIADPRGGQGITMTITAVPVYGKAVDPVTGKAIPPNNAQPIAYAYNIPKGGTNTLIYGYLVKDPSDPTKSVMHYSDEANPPWNDKLPVSPSTSGGNHFEVDFSSYLPTTAAPTGAPGSQALAIDKTHGGQVAITGPDGKPIEGVTVTDPGKPTPANPRPEGDITFDPYTLARTSDTERNALGGTDPSTDFTSLTVANLMGDEDGRGIMRALDQHPEFKSQITFDTNTYAGVQMDPKTGAWVPGTGDPTKMQQASNQANIAQNAKSLFDFVGTMAQNWQRVTTGSPYPNNNAPGANIAAQQDSSLAKLATDLTKGTPFENIAKVFLPGTLTQKPPTTKSGEDLGTFTIKQAQEIKVPQATVKTVVTNDQKQGAMGGATSAVAPPPQPTVAPPSSGHYGPRAL